MRGRTSPACAAALLALVASCGRGTILDYDDDRDAAVGDDDPTPDAHVVAPGDPDARVVQPGDPDARGLEPNNPDARVVEPGDPDARVVEPGDPDARVVEPGDPDAGGSTGLNCRNAASWPAEWTALENQVVVLINARRAAGATCGGTARPPVGPVTANNALREAARCHSLDMGENGYFSHDSQDGRDPWERMDEAGYDASPTGENIAAGYGTAAEVVAGWMTSSGHCENIMNGNSNEMGIGLANVEGSPFGNYWTQGFGRR